MIDLRSERSLYSTDLDLELDGLIPEVPPVAWYVPNVTIAYDADTGGLAGTLRAGEMLQNMRGEGWRQTPGGLRCDWDDARLADEVVRLRHACKLPLSDGFLLLLRAALACHEGEARRRTRVRRSTRPDRAPEWQQFDLLGAVRAVTGAEGRRAGANWWLPCPFHEDRTPSLEVEPDKRLWHCWGCGESGGVREWQKMVESRVTPGPKIRR